MSLIQFTSQLIVVICVFNHVSVLSEAAVSAETKAIVTALNAELDSNKLKQYMLHGGSMDSAIGNVLTFIPKINTGYVCILANFNDGIDTFVANDGSVTSLVDFFIGKCSSDANLLKCLKIVQDPATQSRLGTVLLQLFNKMPKKVVNIGTTIVNTCLSSKPLTASVVTGVVKQIKALPKAAKQSLFVQLPSTKLVLNKQGKYYNAFQNLMSSANFIFGTKTPTADQITKANDSLKQGCQYLHENFNQFFAYVTTWINSYQISSSVKSNLTLNMNYGTSSAVLGLAGKALLGSSSTQETIDSIFNECYSI